MPIYIMCTARGCLGYKQDDEEKNEYGENIGKFAKLLEYFGTILFILITAVYNNNTLGEALPQLIIRCDVVQLKDYLIIKKHLTLNT